MFEFLGEVFRRLHYLLHRRRLNQELNDDMEFHREMMSADRRRSFGNPVLLRERAEEAWGWTWLSQLAQDLSYAARMLMRSPGFTLTAVVVLALGIGVNTLAFSLYNLLALQSIPVRDPQSLVSFERRSPENITPGFPWNSIVYFREHEKTLSAVMAKLGAAPMVLDRDEQRARPEFVSGNYFGELGGAAAAGRLFDASRDDSESAAPVAVLSYRFWQRRYAGNAAIVGQLIHLGGKPATVIGVTAESFANLGQREPDLWLPIMQHQYFVGGSKPLGDPNFEGMITVTGRLAPGVTSAQAAQELVVMTDQLRKLYPAVIWDKEYVRLSPGAQYLEFNDHSYPLLAMIGLLVLLILAVACANLGGLLMARGAGRQHEIQIRMWIGAGRWRIFRQLITESLLLAFLGALAALPLSIVALRLTLLSVGAPSWMSAAPDWRVLVFTALVGLLASLFFGLMPALQMVRHRRGKAIGHQVVVAVQVAASCVLLILAGLLVRGTLHTLYTDPGFQYEQVLSIDSGLGAHGYTPVKAREFLDQLEQRLRVVPGVTSVAMAFRPPLVSDGVMYTSIRVDGREILVYPNWVGPQFIQTMGIPLLRGRFLQEGDKDVVVLSDSLARKRWPKEDPIGKRWEGGKDVVVGVVGNTRAMELNNSDATEAYYPPTDENLPGMCVLVKVSGAAGGVSSAVQAITASLDSNLFPTVTPLKVGFHKHVAEAEQATTVVSLLGCVAIFLAMVGLLGLVSYAVSQRMKEIAIRLAMGANRAVIFSTVLRRFALPVLAGMVLGIGITTTVSQILRRVLYGISGLDPLSYFAAVCFLAVVLVAAGSIPIRRALQVDIARILHSE